MSVHTVRGMKDLLPPESSLWNSLGQRMRGHFSVRGYSEIRTPILEKSELFLRSIGETTDIVEKEMYTFTDKSGESVTMRPEGTGPVVRAYLQNRGAFGDKPVRLFYMGPMFRHERPQKGRLRQFHQAGAEVLGSEEPYVDAEVIIALHDLFDDLRIEGVSLEVNSLGCPVCRPGYHDALHSYIETRISGMCSDCQRRYDRNPLRVLDCKSAQCGEVKREAPSILDFLCGDCRPHFDEVCRILNRNGINYKVNSRMVRGLDYYQRTTFEFIADGLGAQNAVAAGGRYDGLAEMIGASTEVPGVGFAIGIERLILLIPKEGITGKDKGVSVFLVVQSPSFIDSAYSLKRKIEGKGISCHMDYGSRSMKSQMRKANRIEVAYAVIFGEGEMARGCVTVKEMGGGSEEEVSLDHVLSRIMDNG